MAHILLGVRNFRKGSVLLVFSKEDLNWPTKLFDNRLFMSWQGLVAQLQMHVTVNKTYF